MASLDNVIAAQIAERGPISFSDFMEACLYYPGLGYYMNEADKIGADGDFFTSSNLSSSFGAMVGKQMEELWYVLGQKEFTVVEYGAGTGMLCHDILQYLESNPRLYDKLRYCIIEISPSMRKAEQAHLKDKVTWYDSLAAIEGDIDCVFSNELLDNFPVHQVMMEEELMEVFVAYDDGFKEILRPAGASLKKYLEALGITLPPGFRTEISLKAVDWIREVAAKLRRGFIITIDYGGLSEELYKNGRHNGTLLCYCRHGINDQPFSNIGQQDITAHVNFSALQHWGSKEGIATWGMTSQAMFLLALGFRDHLRNKTAERDKNIVQLAVEEARIMHTLLLDMGQKIKVLVQAKAVPYTRLQGLGALS